MKRKLEKDTIKVFRLLGLETELDRQRVGRLAEPGRETLQEGDTTFRSADTRNHTRQGDDDAQLEPVS